MAGVSVNVNVDAAAVLGSLRNAEKRMAYAIAGAISATMLDVQDAIRARTKSHLVVRRSEFVMREVAKIDKADFPKAKEGKFTGRIHVGQKDRLLLSLLESGGHRAPFVGHRVAVPITGGAARPAFKGKVAPSLQVQKLELRQRGATSQRKGAKRTFVLENLKSGAKPGVFQRVNKSTIRRLYSFASDVRVRPLLGFLETASRRTNEVFYRYLDAEIRSAIAYSLSSPAKKG